MRFQPSVVAAALFTVLGVGYLVRAQQAGVPGLVSDPKSTQLSDTIKIPMAIQWPEGPIWLGDRLILGDTRGSMIWEIKDGYKKAIAGPLGIPGGHAFLPDGTMARTLGAGQVVRVDGTGVKQLEVLAQEYDGKIFNGPNDLVVRSDGSVYFTDPIWGLRGRRSALGFEGVYRISPDKKVTLLTKDVAYPNGIAFSPDEKTLYVNDYTNAPDFQGTILAFDVNPDGSITNRRAFGPKGAAGDGLKVDAKGNLWSAGPRGGVLILAPDGKEVGHVPFPGTTINLAWGGAKGTTLFVTTTEGVYQMETSVTSASKFGPK
jgi:gluconolactonase